MNHDSRHKGRELHNEINHIKQTLADAKQSLEEVSMLEYVVCDYTLRYCYDGGMQTIRINAPVDAVKTVIQKDIEELETQLAEKMEEYQEWVSGQ